MKAALLTGIRQFEIKQVPEPTLSRDTDVLVRIKLVGVCGSDIHYYTTGRIGRQIVRFPFIIGHEAAGVVERTGGKVTRVKPGQRIAIDPAVSCGQCDQCRAGREHTCRKLLFLGCPQQLTGALCEYIVLPEASCYPIRDGITFEQATLSEPLAIAVYTVERSPLPTGANVGILGAGPIGMSVFHALRAKPEPFGGETTTSLTPALSPGRGRSVSSAGQGSPFSDCSQGEDEEFPLPGERVGVRAGQITNSIVSAQNIGNVYVTDKVPERLHYAQRLNPCWCGNPDREDVVKAISDLEPLLLDVVYECSGDPAAYRQAIRLLKPGGAFVVVGIPEVDDIPFPIHELRRREITVINIRRQAHCTQKAIDLLERRRVDMDAMATHHFPLAETQQAFDLVAHYRDGVVKAMITVD